MAKQMITSNEARAKFKNMGLSYKVLDETRIRLLYKMIKTELKNFRKEDTAKMDMKRSDKLDMKVTNEGQFISAFMYVNGGYFKQREAISFNSDGFIGFTGWASSLNSQPFLRAFMKWCDIIGELKDA